MGNFFPLHERLRYLTGAEQIVSHRVLRLGCDWLTWYYDNKLTITRFCALKKDFDFVIAGVLVHFQARCTPMALVLLGEGWYLRLLAPDRREEDDRGIKQHEIEVQAQGRAWAAGLDFDRALADVERMLGLEEMSESARIPGRVDLAADIWWREMSERYHPTPEGCHLAMCADGSAYVVREHWATRARRAQASMDLGPPDKDTNKPSRKRKLEDDGAFANVVGANRGLPTMYLGSRGGVQLCFYCKSADFKGNTKGALLGDWRAAGWDGSGVVSRLEVRICREAIRERVWPVAGKGDVPGEQLTLAELRSLLALLWTEALGWFRFAPRVPGVVGFEARTARHRRTVPLWNDLLDAAPRLTDGVVESGRIVAADRKFRVDELERRAWRTLVNIQEAIGDTRIDELVRKVRVGAPDVELYRGETAWKGFRLRALGLAPLKRAKVESVRIVDDDELPGDVLARAAEVLRAAGARPGFEEY